MDKKFIEERKQDLIARNENIKKQLSTFAKKTRLDNDYQTEWTEFGDKEDDSVSEVENFERNLNLEGTLEVSLQKTDKALKRIEDGTYGRCEKCGQPIEEGRLRVFPSATSCMKCKKANL